LVQCILVEGNSGLFGPLQRGGNHKNVKMGCGILKIFSRTTGPVLTRLGKNHPWEEGFKFAQIKGLAPLRRKVIANE
jgi:hypothetical protein